MFITPIPHKAEFLNFSTELLGRSSNLRSTKSAPKLTPTVDFGLSEAAGQCILSAVRFLLQTVVLALALLLGATSRLPTASLESRELNTQEVDAFVRWNEARIVLHGKARPKPKLNPHQATFARAPRTQVGHEVRPALSRGYVSARLPRRVAYSNDNPLEPDGVLET